MTYTGVVFSPQSGFKKIVLAQELISVLNRDSQKYCYTRFSSNGNRISTFPTCYPFKISTKLFHLEAKFKEPWWSDSYMVGLAWWFAIFMFFFVVFL